MNTYPVYRPMRFVDPACCGYGKAGQESCIELQAKTEKWKKRASYGFPKSLMYPQARKKYDYWASRLDRECGGVITPDSSLADEANVAVDAGTGGMSPLWIVGGSVLALAVLAGGAIAVKRSRGR